MKTNSTILITGANRGLGLATAQVLFKNGFNVILGMRRIPNNSKKFLLAHGLIDKKDSPRFCMLMELDVLNDKSIDSAYRLTKKKIKCLSGIINNAGVLSDVKNASSKINAPLIVPGKNVRSLRNKYNRYFEAFGVNTMGAVRIVQGFNSLLKKDSFILNISSLAGQISSMESGLPSYSISKAALNAVTRIMADEFESRGVKCISLSPGWIKTEMGGKNATLTLEQGAKNILRIVKNMPELSSGLFYRDGKVIPW